MRPLSAEPYALAAAVAITLLAAPGQALDSGTANERAKSEITAVEGELSHLNKTTQGKSRQAQAAERVAAGELSLRTRDYGRAIDSLNQVLELYQQGKVDLNAYVDSMFLLGEAYFADNQLLAARRQYWAILDQSTSSPYNSYAGRALARLVDIALRSDNVDQLKVVFTKLDQLTPDASGSIDYARAKAYFADNRVAEARAAVERVPRTGQYYHQAQYLLGVIKMKEEAAAAKAAPGTEAKPARFSAAIAQFRQVTTLPTDTPEHKQVVDLSWMALGRLLYESERYLESAEAYGHIERTSGEFNDMLYELSWVYVRLGDYKRAQRALEVLAITSPETLNLADGSLLRADLLLRSGEYAPALELYQNVRDRFDPAREKVDDFLASSSDPSVYYDKLLEEPLAVEQEGRLPQIVTTWVREVSEDTRVFALVDDITRSRDLVKRSRRLVQKLDGLLASSTRTKAFPELKQQLEVVVGLLNRIGQMRRVLALGLEDENDSALNGEIGSVRAERRALMARMGILPVTPIDFVKREQTGERQWELVSQELQRVTLEADRLQAMVNGLTRILREGKKQGVTISPESMERFENEVAANERDLDGYRQRIDMYREAIETGRVQIGFGDQRFVDDQDTRNRFRQVLEREVTLAAEGAGGGGLAEYARTIQPLLTRAAAAEDRLRESERALGAEVDEQAAGVRKVVEEESARVESNAKLLDDLDQHSRVLIGEVAMKNFALVRDRLKGIVLRADVGIVQQAWEIREEQRRKLIDLQRARAAEEQNINNELREVLDDTEEAL
jgi:tetratricopeptide (TPR) repeat protein